MGYNECVESFNIFFSKQYFGMIHLLSPTACRKYLNFGSCCGCGVETQELIIEA